MIPASRPPAPRARRVLMGVALVLTAGCKELESTKPLNHEPTFTTTPPTKLANGKPVKPGLTYTYQPAAEDKDPADTFSIRMAAGAANATFTGGVLAWTPTLAQVGLEQVFRLEATDSRGGMTPQTWSITPEVRGAPSALVLAPVGSAVPTELHPFAWTLAFEDDDPGTVTVAVRNPAGAVFDRTTRTIAWTPPPGAPAGSVVVDLQNNVGLPATQVLNYTVEKNKSPVITPLAAPNSVVEGDVYSAQFGVADPNGDPIGAASLSATVSYQGGVATPGPQVAWDATNGRATLTWTPAVGANYRGKTVGVDLTAADAFGAANTLSTPLLVAGNKPPAITADGSNPASIVEGSFLSLKFQIADPEGDFILPNTVVAQLKYQGLPLSPAASLDWDGPNGRASVSWTPALGAAYIGQSVTLNLAATDAKGASDNRDFVLSVPANKPPTITADPANPSSIQAGNFLTLKYVIQDPDNDLVAPASVGAVISHLSSVIGPGTASWDPANRRLTLTWIPAVAAPYVGQTVVVHVFGSDSKGAQGTQDFGLVVTP